MDRRDIENDGSGKVVEKARVSSIQMFMLLIGFLYGSTVILNSALGAKNDAWLAILLGGAGGALLMGVYVAIALLNSSRTLVEILRDRFGKSVGNAVSILYIWYFIHLASLVFRNFGEFIATVTFPETPMVVVVGIFAIILVYAVNSGVEVIGRLSELLVPVLPVVVLIICLSLITTHDFTAFLPMLENGMAPVLNAAFGFIAFPFGETVAFLMLFPHLNKKGSLKKIAALSVLFMVALSLLLFFMDITVLGSDLMQQATFVPHLTALLIPGMNVEPLVDINLLIGGGVKISVCIYAAARALSQVAGIGDYRKLTTAITTFCVVLSIWVYGNVLEMFSWAEKVWSYYSIPFQMVIPLLLLFLSLRKRAAPSDARNES
jgi:spore germination protein KB